MMGGVKRREFLAVGGVGVVGMTSGCTQQQRTSATTDFAFPAGVSSDGVDDPQAAMRGHLLNAASLTYTAEFRRESERPGRDTGMMRAGNVGPNGPRRWEIDTDRTAYTDVYRGSDILYAGTEWGDGNLTSILEVGSTMRERQFERSRDAALRWVFVESFHLPFGTGSLSIQDDEEPAVAVFSVEEPPEGHPTIERIENMELAVDERGVVRHIDARYTLDNGGGAKYEEVSEYAMDVGRDPPAELRGPPASANEYPRLDVEWRDEGRVMAVTNTGNRPLKAFADLRFFTDEEAVSERGYRLVDRLELQELKPDTTGYIYVSGSLTLAGEPPASGGEERLRGDRPPVFRYGANGQVIYDSACDGLDCS